MIKQNIIKLSIICVVLPALSACDNGLKHCEELLGKKGTCQCLYDSAQQNQVKSFKNFISYFQSPKEMESFFKVADGLKKEPFEDPIVFLKRLGDMLKSQLSSESPVFQLMGAYDQKESLDDKVQKADSYLKMGKYCYYETEAEDFWKNITQQKITYMAQDGFPNKNKYLLLASKYNENPEIINTFIEAGADVNAKIKEDGVEVPLLAKAIEQNQKEAVETLIKAGADVNAKIKYADQAEAPLVSYAIFFNQKEIAEMLIKAGADVNAKFKYADQAEEPLLYFAIYKKQKEIAEMLIKAGADVNAKIAASEAPLLSYAISENQKEIAEMLIKAGADVNATLKTGGGESPLLYDAIIEGEKEIAEMLIKAGADVNAKVRPAKGFETPLLFSAINKNQKEIVEMLIKAGADVNAKIKGVESERTLLYFAIYKNQKEIAEMLIKAGAK